jgi:hypothetical protein
VTISRAWRVVLADGVVVLAAVLLFPAFIALRADGNQIIEPEAMDFLLLAIATLLIASGVQLAPWRAAPYLAFLAMLGAAALLFGILGAFGIGLAFLPLGIVALVLLYRALRRRPLSAGRPAAIGGALVGYGAILLYIALIVPPTVECFLSGGGTSSGRWGGAGIQQITGSVAVSPDGVVTGSIETPTSIATYRCEHGRIVEFHREAR